MMRKVESKTLKDIIKRDQREAVRGRGTAYRVDFMSFGYDPTAVAWVQTPCKTYCLYRSMSQTGVYDVIRVKTKQR